VIPLIGARVRVKSGPRNGQVGFVEIVYDASDVLRDPMATAQVKRLRAQLGADWHLVWYEADVSFDSGSERMEGAKLEIQEPDMIRPERYSTV
jgi:hypothetical protein